MGRTFLRQGLDKDIYQIITKLQDEGVETLDSATVYQKIKRSNSSLSRKSKVLLEDSIERVLSLLQEQASDSDPSNEPAEAATQQPKLADSSNTMNQRIAESMRSAASQTNGQEPGQRPNKRQVPASASGEQRGSKRPRQRELPAVDPPTHVSLRDVGGMDNVIKKLRKFVMLPLMAPGVYAKRSLKYPRGILLHGPPGCGKTMLAEALAGTMGLPFLKIDATSVVSGMSGESEKAIRQHFEHAASIAPCLVFIDEIDSVTPKRETASREMERRIVTQLLTCMDGLATIDNPVIVLAATNRPDSIDAALRRPGRFDEEINIGVPNDSMREQILRAQTKDMDLSSDVNFSALGKMTPGFVGADLVSLVFKANLEALDRLTEDVEARAAAYDASTTVAGGDDSDVEMDAQATPQEPKSEIDISISVARFLSSQGLQELADTSCVISMDDFVKAIPQVQPTAKREGFATIPETTWDNIGALQEVRKQLQFAVTDAIREPERYRQFDLGSSAGVLLWGPPGCGKTLLAKAVANESRANFISIKGPELLNKYVGESEKAVRQVFFRARSSVPCIIFFDELDALSPRRDGAGSESSARVVNTLLTELDGLDDRSGIYVIGATNRPEMIDLAMLRPGRLGVHIFVGLPGPSERVEILATLLKRKRVEDINCATDVARKCESFSGADLASLAHEAASLAMRRGSDCIQLQDLTAAAATVKPSVTPADILGYSSWKSGRGQINS